MKLFLLVLAITIYSTLASATTDNTIHQTVTGTVLDADNKQAIIGALVQIEGFAQTSITDMNGRFIIEQVPIGRINVLISSLGYEALYLNQQLLTSSKQLVLQVELFQKTELLEEAQVTSSQNKGEVANEMAVLSARQFSVEETKRYPGSFNDPARMVSAYAGVSTNAEGTNEIIVRGNTPRGILWRLEGIEIPNPNHFGNEGATGGPISILNVDMLDNSEFYTGAFPGQFGNALSGVFDISLRTGNPNQYEFSAGIGMLGLEATAEGPLGNNNYNSFLVNYRYSALDLIDKLDIADFGGIPRYQDAAFNVNMRTADGGSLSVFGLGGLSNISDKVYEDEENETNLLYTNDFNTSMGVVGVKHLLPINKNLYFINTVSASGYSNNDLLDKNVDSTLKPMQEDIIANTYLKVASTAFLRSNNRNRFQFGGIATRSSFKLESKDYDFDRESWTTHLNSSGNDYFFQAFAAWKYDINDKLIMTSGIHGTYFNLNQNYSIEPRLAIQYQIDIKRKISLAGGLHSKLESMSIYLGETPNVGNITAQTNKDLDLTKAWHIVLGYDHFLSKNLHVRGEVYYQYLFDVPTGLDGEFGINYLNSGDGFTTVNLNNEGLGRNYGIDLTFERFLNNDYFFLISGSLFNSEYKNPNDQWRKGRYAGDYTFNTVVGKEFLLKQSERGKQTLSTSLKASVLGGKRYTDVLVAESIAADEDIRDTSNPYGVKAPDVFFINLAVTYRIDKAKVAHELKLDIQNVTNNQAEIGKYYDSVSKDIVSYYQLAMFPVLSYKIYF